VKEERKEQENEKEREKTTEVSNENVSTKPSDTNDMPLL
jgi:hypothetical protein